MTRRTRRTLFYALLGLFFVLGASVVLYAQGWRLDLRTLRLEKVGGIFVRSFPEDARIYLDGKTVENKVGLLSRGTLISDLFPGTYGVSLKQDGYADWHEDASVLPALVTELKHAVLVPKNSVAAASGTVKRFSVVSGEAILEKPDGAVIWRGKKIGNGGVASESTDLKNIIIKNAATGRYSLYDFDRTTSTNLSSAFAASAINIKSITGIAIDPYDAAAIIVHNNQKIWIVGTAQATSSPIERAPAGRSLGPSIAASRAFLAWTRYADASGASRVMLYDKFSNALMKSSSTVAGRNLSLAWITNNTLGVLQDDGSLYRYDVAANRFQKLADDVRNFEATSDGVLLAAVENRSLEIFSFADANAYHRFNLPGMASVARVLWYKDMNHLFVEYPDHVSFLDLGDAGVRNFPTVAEGTSPFYEAVANALYLVNPGSKLIRFNFPG